MKNCFSSKIQPSIYSNKCKNQNQTETLKSMKDIDAWIQLNPTKDEMFDLLCQPFSLRFSSKQRKHNSVQLFICWKIL